MTASRQAREDRRKVKRRIAGEKIPPDKMEIHATRGMSSEQFLIELVEQFEELYLRIDELEERLDERDRDQT